MDEQQKRDNEPEFRMCVFHREHDYRLKTNEKSVEDIWKAINTMRNWVVVGSGSMILSLVLVVINLLHHS
jgi:hypothetical protein